MANHVSADTSSLLNKISGNLGGVPVNYDAFEPSVVLAGEDVTELVTIYGNELKIAYGLKQIGERVIATSCGKLQFQKPNWFWVDNPKHKYIPKNGDTIIGVITKTFSEEYSLDIGSYTIALLPSTGFDGATKRSKPNLKVGDVVYCRVVTADRDIEPQLTCKAPTSMARKDWSSGEALFGELSGGFMFKVSIGLCLKLLRNDCVVLNSLAKHLAFEIAVGMNNRVWINAEKPKDLVLISNAIQKSESLLENQIDVFVSKLVEAAKMIR